MPTQRFLNLPATKQARIMAAAVAEFAREGFEHANTNRIAQAAEISVGALFKYFDTKDELFLHVVEQGSGQIEQRVEALIQTPGTLSEKLEALLWAVVETSRSEREHVQLYHEITAIGNRELAHDLALQLEGFTSRAYTELVRQAQADGEVREDLDPGIAAWLFDNVLMQFQYSLACTYHANRLSQYAPDLDDDTLVRQTHAFLAAGLGIRA